MLRAAARALGGARGAAQLSLAPAGGSLPDIFLSRGAWGARQAWCASTRPPPPQQQQNPTELLPPVCSCAGHPAPTGRVQPVLRPWPHRPAHPEPDARRVGQGGGAAPAPPLACREPLALRQLATGPARCAVFLCRRAAGAHHAALSRQRSAGQRAAGAAAQLPRAAAAGRRGGTRAAAAGCAGAPLWAMRGGSSKCCRGAPVGGAACWEPQHACQQAHN